MHRWLVLASLSGAIGCNGAGPSALFARGSVDPNALWEIVSTCIDAPARVERRGPFCSCPAFARSCCGDRATADAAVVWAETESFVAIRNMTACGCPSDFVAGLALPRARVTGIEDPARPEGIWPFAWDVARPRIGEPLEIGLAINPVDVRSQNQMHVHLLRLKPGMRAILDAGAISGSIREPVPATIVRVANLDAVFAAAHGRVGANLGRHGILVAAARDGGFLVVITDRRSPQAFTRNTCKT